MMTFNDKNILSCRLFSELRSKFDDRANENILKTDKPAEIDDDTDPQNRIIFT
jgi:hypothetical protein